MSPAAIICEHRFIISCMDCITCCTEGIRLAAGVATRWLIGACDTLGNTASLGPAGVPPPSVALAHEAEPTKPAPARKMSATPRKVCTRLRPGMSSPSLI